MAVVLGCQVSNSCLDDNQARGDSSSIMDSISLKNDSDHFLRVDPKLPSSEAGVATTSHDRQPETIVTREHSYFINPRFRMEYIVSSERKPKVKLRYKHHLSLPERSIKSILVEFIPVLRAHNKRDEPTSSYLVNDTEFDVSYSQFPSDPDVPSRNDCSNLDSSISNPLVLNPPTLRYLKQKGEVHSKKQKQCGTSNLRQVKFRHERKRCLGLSTTNGMHFRSINIIAHQFQTGNLLFLPVLRDMTRKQLAVDKPLLPKLSQLMHYILPFQFLKSRPNHFDLRLGWKNRREPLFDSIKVRLRTCVSTNLHENLDVLTTHEPTCQQITLEEEIAPTVELAHLAKKVQSVSTNQINHLALDVIENSTSSNIPQLHSTSNDELVLFTRCSTDGNVVQSSPRDVCTSRAKNGTCPDRNEKKRSEATDNEISRKERKRRKTERKREKRARKDKRKEKRKRNEPRYESCSNEIPCITVPSLHVGVMPMVMTRRIQTTTEEICFATQMTPNNSRLHCKKDNTASKSPNVTNASSVPRVFTYDNCDVETDKQVDCIDCRVDSTSSSSFWNQHEEANRSDNQQSAVTSVTTLSKVEKSGIPYNSELIDASMMCDKLGDESAVEPSISRNSKLVTCERSNQSDVITHGTEGAGSNLCGIQQSKPISSPFSCAAKIRPSLRETEQNKFMCLDENSTRIPGSNYDGNTSMTPEAPKRKKDEPHEKNLPNITTYQILCGEDFFHYSSQAAAELVSGSWVDTIMHNQKGTSKTPKFELRDTKLIDDCGVDIELPNSVGVKIIWAAIPSSSEVFDSKNHCKNLVQLASTGRYITIHVIVVLRVDGSNYNIDDFCLLQNALVKQRGCVCQKISFKYVEPSVLGATIAQLIISQQCAPFVGFDSLFTDHALEKASFLLGLMPSLTVYEALSLLNGNSNRPFGEFILKIIGDSCIKPVSMFQLRKCLQTNVGNFCSF